jgi:hypothetical protein
MQPGSVWQAWTDQAGTAVARANSRRYARPTVVRSSRWVGYRWSILSCRTAYAFFDLKTAVGSWAWPSAICGNRPSLALFAVCWVTDRGYGCGALEGVGRRRCRLAIVRSAGPSPAADEAAEDAGRGEDPQQVRGGIPVQPWFERAFAQQGVDDVPGAGGAARFGPSSISEHLIERLEASAKLRVRLSGWAAARGPSRGSRRSRGPGACQILEQRAPVVRVYHRC